MNQPVQTLQIDQWTVKARIPPGRGPHPVIVMIHGWMGDENSMWVFSPKIPEEYLVIAPRGIIPVPTGGYSWAERPGDGYSEASSFDDAVMALDDLLALRPGAPNQPFEQVALMGFSQGAALSYAYTARHPERVAFVLGLAGFVPGGLAPAEGALQGKPFYVAHGSRDEIVPLDQALEGIQRLRGFGAKVSYCEADVGHKLGADCLSGVEVFLSRFQTKG